LDEFIEDLEKQHSLFSLQQKDELNRWFREKQKHYEILEWKIKKFDDSIDAEVYKLYRLLDDDIEIILGSIQLKDTHAALLKNAA